MDAVAAVAALLSSIFSEQYWSAGTSITYTSSYHREIIPKCCHHEVEVVKPIIISIYNTSE